MPKKNPSHSKQDLENHLKRALADYQNLEKRIAQDRVNIIKFANSGLIANLLPCLEILEKASFHSRDEGVKIAVDQFRRTLSAEGLEEIAPAPGEDFNPDLHECTESLPAAPAQSGKIAELVSKGYRFKDGLVLQPAKVKVYKYKEEDVEDKLPKQPESVFN